uniref:Uncharacterized protein n=1 Tax=viral metagenome TaxID=1070528 RepID=A0A6C0D6L5_9ZZZZ
MIHVSVGELYDKFTILTIKNQKITDPTKKASVQKEIVYLQHVILNITTFPPSETRLVEQLRTINAELWDIEDKIREKERLRQFDREFIELARSIYKKNDKRSAIKNEINTVFNSELIDIKSYENY